MLEVPDYTLKIWYFDIKKSNYDNFFIWSTYYSTQTKNKTLSNLTCQGPSVSIDTVGTKQGDNKETGNQKTRFSHSKLFAFSFWIESYRKYLSMTSSSYSSGYFELHLSTGLLEIRQRRWKLVNGVRNSSTIFWPRIFRWKFVNSLFREKFVYRVQFLTKVDKKSLFRSLSH